MSSSLGSAKAAAASAYPLPQVSSGGRDNTDKDTLLFLYDRSANAVSSYLKHERPLETNSSRLLNFRSEFNVIGPKGTGLLGFSQAFGESVDGVVCQVATSELEELGKLFGPAYEEKSLWVSNESGNCKAKSFVPNPDFVLPKGKAEGLRPSKGYYESLVKSLKEAGVEDLSRLDEARQRTQEPLDWKNEHMITGLSNWCRGKSVNLSEGHLGIQLNASKFDWSQLEMLYNLGIKWHRHNYDGGKWELKKREVLDSNGLVTERVDSISHKLNEVDPCTFCYPPSLREYEYLQEALKLPEKKAP